MKIINQQSLVQQVPTNINGRNNKKSSTNTQTSLVDNPSKDSIQIIKHNTQNVSRINELQQDIANSQQMFGSLTLLTEAIELFQKKPSVQLENIKKLVQELEKTGPQLAEKIFQHINDPKKIAAEVDTAKQEVTQNLKTQKQQVARYLITEQNKDALAHRTVSRKDASDIASNVNPDVYNTPSAISARLLS